MTINRNKTTTISTMEINTTENNYEGEINDLIYRHSG